MLLTIQRNLFDVAHCPGNTNENAKTIMSLSCWVWRDTVTLWNTPNTPPTIVNPTTAMFSFH